MYVRLQQLYRRPAADARNLISIVCCNPIHRQMPRNQPKFSTLLANFCLPFAPRPWQQATLWFICNKYQTWQMKRGARAREGCQHLNYNDIHVLNAIQFRKLNWNSLATTAKLHKLQCGSRLWSFSILAASSAKCRPTHTHILIHKHKISTFFLRDLHISTSCGRLFGQNAFAVAGYLENHTQHDIFI